MFAKKLIILLVAAVFTLGAAGLSFSAQEVKGTVANINIKANTMTVVDEKGQHVTVKVEDPKILEALKVGDRVDVKDGEVKKEKSD